LDAPKRASGLIDEVNASDAENFAFDCSEVEPAVVTHKSCDGLKLAFDKGLVIGDDGDADGGDKFAVVVVNFGNRDVESALQPANNAFDDTAFLFERADTVKVQVGCHHADYHKQSPVALVGTVSFEESTISF